MATRDTGLSLQPLTSLETSRRSTPEAALATLRNWFGLTPADPQDPGGAAYGDPTGSLALASLREARAGELEDRLANDAFGGPDPNTGRDALLLKFLKGDQASDPYTGQAATDRTHRVETNLDEATLYNRPEIAGMRREQEAVKEQLATAPARTTGQYTLQHQQLENVGNLEKQRLANQGLLDVARVKTTDPYGGTGTPGAPTTAGAANEVEYWAKQIAQDPRLRTQIAANKPLLNAVNRHLAASGGDIQNVTTQTRQMGEAASDLLPMIDHVQTQAEALQKIGLFTPGVGTLRNFLASHGMGGMLGLGPEVAGQIGQFNTDMGLLESGVARAHAGARGAGNAEIAQRFERLMASQGDLPTFLGELKGVRDLLSIYAKHASGGGASSDAPPSPAAPDPMAGFHIER